MRSRVVPRNIWLVASLVILAGMGLWGLSSMESIVDYYRILRIDPKTLKVSYSGMIWFGSVRDIQGDYYESLLNVAIAPHRRYVSHVERRGASPLISFGAMFVSADGMITSRDKRQVLARLPEATIVAQTQYYYADGHAQFPPEILVSSREDLGWEVPREEPALPQSGPPSVTGAALVRVLKQADGSVCVVSANYRLDGQLKALATRHLRDGVLDNSTASFRVNGQPCGDQVNFVDEPSRRDAFGFPEQFRTAEYLRDPGLPSVVRAVPSVMDIVILEYNLNEWVRQDRYVLGTLAATQFLHFKDLPEDIVLAPLDKGSGSR
jgi:hypothetical protein